MCSMDFAKSFWTRSFKIVINSLYLCWQTKKSSQVLSLSNPSWRSQFLSSTEYQYPLMSFCLFVVFQTLSISISSLLWYSWTKCGSNSIFSNFDEVFVVERTEKYFGLNLGTKYLWYYTFLMINTHNTFLSPLWWRVSGTMQEAPSKNFHISTNFLLCLKTQALKGYWKALTLDLLVNYERDLETLNCSNR